MGHPLCSCVSYSHLSCGFHSVFFLSFFYLLSSEPPSRLKLGVCLLNNKRAEVFRQMMSCHLGGGDAIDRDGSRGVIKEGRVSRVMVPMVHINGRGLCVMPHL